MDGDNQKVLEYLNFILLVIRTTEGQRNTERAGKEIKIKLQIEKKGEREELSGHQWVSLHIDCKTVCVFSLLKMLQIWYLNLT